MVLDVISSWAIILLRRELVALLCVVDACVLCLFLTVPCVALQSVIVAFPGQENMKRFSCSTPLSTKFHLLIIAKIPTIEEVFCFKSPRCCIYHSNKC